MERTLSNNKERSRKWFITAHLDDKGLQFLKSLLNMDANAKNGLKIAIIKHDKDLQEDGSPKLEHYHSVIEWTNARSFESMKSAFEGCHIEKAINWTACVHYLTHKNDSNKYQYPFEDIETNSPQWLQYEYDKKIETTSKQMESDLIDNILSGKYQDFFDLVVSRDFDMTFLNARKHIIDVLFNGLHSKRLRKMIEASNVATYEESDSDNDNDVKE